MTEKDLARTWSQYVKELAVLLVAVEGRDPPAEVLERIQALVQRELLFLYIRRATLASELLCSRAGWPVHEGATLPTGKGDWYLQREAGADGPLGQVVNEAESLQTWAPQTAHNTTLLRVCARAGRRSPT